MKRRGPEGQKPVIFLVRYVTKNTAKQSSKAHLYFDSNEEDDETSDDETDDDDDNENDFFTSFVKTRHKNVETGDWAKDLYEEELLGRC